MQQPKPKPRARVIPIPSPKPQPVLPLDWTDRKDYQQHLAELKRISIVEGRREAEMVLAAERAAELRFLRRKEILLARIAKGEPGV